MGNFNKLIITVFVVSLLGGVGLSLQGYDSPAMDVASPALILSAWSCFGHFITLDDDMPRAWSNAEGSKKVWYSSILELFAKITVFVVVVLLVYV